MLSPRTYALGQLVAEEEEAKRHTRQSRRVREVVVKADRADCEGRRRIMRIFACLAMAAIIWPPIPVTARIHIGEYLSLSPHGHEFLSPCGYERAAAKAECLNCGNVKRIHIGDLRVVSSYCRNCQQETPHRIHIGDV